jgi:hypothetical protein
VEWDGGDRSQSAAAAEASRQRARSSRAQGDDDDLMALLTTVKQLGKLTVTIYHFEKTGDELPVHVHAEDANHISLISVGSFKVIGDPAISGNILTQGMIVDWPAMQEHGFVALSDGARMIQIQK